MNLRIKTSLFFATLFISMTVVIVFFIENFIGASFKKQIANDLVSIGEQSEGVYLTFLDGIKMSARNWSSDARIVGISKAISKADAGTPEKARLAKEFSTYVKNSKMPFNETVLIVDLLDKNGIVVASTRPDRIGTDELKEEQKLGSHHFSKTITSSFGVAFVKSFIFEEDETDEPMTHVTARIFDIATDGTINPLPAVLLVHFVNTKQLAHALGVDVEESDARLTGDRIARMAFLELYKTSDIYLVDRNSVLASPSRYMKNVGLRQKVDTLPVRECLDNGKEISEEYDNFQGSRVFGTSMCFKDDGVVLIVEVQKDEIYAPLDTINRITIAGGIVLAVFGILVAMLFVRIPLRRIDEVILALERVMKGDFASQAPVHSKDETGRLATMFNTMIESVRTTQKELQDSKSALANRTEILEKDAEEHKKQEQFLDDSKKATLNLLEDAWKAKEELEQQGNKLQTILSSITDGLILIDGSYSILLVNPSAIAMFGMTADMLLGKDLRSIVKLWRKQKEIIPVDIWPIEEVLLTKNAMNGTLDDNFLISTEKHADKLPVVLSIAPLGGGFPGVVVIFRDATEERELDDAKSGFISVASHQLRTPLTSIRWYAEMLLSLDAGPLNDSQKDFMNEIHGGAERLYQTVDLLLGISRVESGKMKSDIKSIDVGVFTGEIIKELKPQIDIKDLAVSIVPPDIAPVIVSLDSLTLRQVILNLISNAIRYTNEKGLIEIKWWMGDEGREVVYMVHDNGIGIPEKERPRIFSKFFRADNARTQVPDGSGLGLALVKELVESWGGKIWFDTAEGQGSTFFFTVPLTTKVEGEK